MDDAQRERERQLAERAREGDMEAFGQLVGLCARDLHAFLYRLTWDDHEAAEATQAAFVRALQAIGSFRGESSFRTWVHRIALNALRNARRDAARRREVPIEEADGRAAESVDPVAAISERQEKERLRRAATALPPRQREVLALRVQAGHSFREAARIMGCSVGAAKAHYFLAVRNLRKRVPRDPGT